MVALDEAGHARSRRHRIYLRGKCRCLRCDTSRHEVLPGTTSRAGAPRPRSLLSILLAAHVCLGTVPGVAGFAAEPGLDGRTDSADRLPEVSAPMARG